MLSRRGTAECANDGEARVAHGGPSVTETTVVSVRRHVDDQFVMLCRHQRERPATPGRCRLGTPLIASLAIKRSCRHFRRWATLVLSAHTAGSSLAHVAQMTIYLVDKADAPEMNRVYARYFTAPPYPNRATVVVKELLGENCLIEIVVHAIKA
jgi:hypothetical protein